ncbi:MAG: 2-succinyl-6-hydroxy-2,4-cyclohexadiene-1-carboxylate synthase [Nostocaceae cyanobacterium]|nr:2-succinyl-6-hydroxy-2,4-cyclohexadiene-1-carboxylate synthase [Nostocaceae cyanobacterium]
MKNYQFNYHLNRHENKPLIVFLHGFMGNVHEFDDAIQLLSKEFSYLTIDLPGHGKTEVLGGDEYYNMENTAQGLMEFLDKLNIHQCFLVGYSMGGRLGLYLTLHYPERFPKVVLESASPGLKTEKERLARIKRDEQIARKLARSIDKSDFANFLFHWYKQTIFGDIKNHPNFAKMINNRLENHPPELAKSLRTMGTGCQPSLWEKIKDNQNHVFLLAGEYDLKFIDINQKISQICDSCQLQIINNVGHNIHFENTLAFIETIREVFKN